MTEEMDERRFRPFQPTAIGPRCVDYSKLSDADQEAIDGFVFNGEVPDLCSLAVKTFLERHHGVGR